MDEMETWEARLLCDNIQYTDINGWEQIRTLCYFYTLSHVKTGTKVKPTDISPKQILPNIYIPSPSNEPTIGVIDTFFDESVYFSK